MMTKLIATILSVVLCVGFAACVPGQTPPPGGPPVPKTKGKGAGKKKGEREPGGDLRKAYDLLRRLRADDGVAGRTEERVREWTDQAAKLYREGLKAQTGGDVSLAREYGAAAHDLARAADYARNASRFDLPDSDLPPPSDDFGQEDTRERAVRDLRRAYERIGWLGSRQPATDSKVYVKAARDLYNAARRDLQAGRDDRAGELARASEAMTHVPEHLAVVGDRGRLGTRPVSRPSPALPDPEGKRAERHDPADSGLPPVLPPE